MVLTVVAAEEGRVVFLTPQTHLRPGAVHTVTVRGAKDADGKTVPVTTIRFTTAGGTTHGHGHAVHTADEAHSHLPRKGPRGGGQTELDDAQWRGQRDRAGKPLSRWQQLPPLLAAPGVTALSGQVLRLNGEPLANATLSIGGVEAQSDATGRFLLQGGLHEGRQGFLMDGSTANAPGRTYGSFFTGVDLVAGKTTVLPWTIWMPLIDTAHAVALPAPTAAPMVITNPRIPGLEVHIPANVTLQTAQGPLQTVTLTQLSVERPPFPVPEGARFLWTPQTHGALVVRPDGTPSPVGVRFIVPNVGQLPAGARVGLQGYSVTKGWYEYGQGTVSAVAATAAAAGRSGWDGAVGPRAALERRAARQRGKGVLPGGKGVLMARKARKPESRADLSRPIPPRSVVELVHADRRTPVWRGQIAGNFGSATTSLRTASVRSGSSMMLASILRPRTRARSRSTSASYGSREKPSTTERIGRRLAAAADDQADRRCPGQPEDPCGAQLTP